MTLTALEARALAELLVAIGRPQTPDQKAAQLRWVERLQRAGWGEPS